MAGNATALMRLLGELKYLAGRSGKAARHPRADLLHARSLPVGVVGDDVAFCDAATLAANNTSQISMTPSDAFHYCTPTDGFVGFPGALLSCL